MAIGQNFYGPEDTIANLNQQQAVHSQFAGNEAAKYADPYLPRREEAGNMLDLLLKSPGDFASSPVYKFAYDQGLGALTASAAARGRLGSGNYLKDLMDYGQGKASQLYFPQANLLAQLSGATTGSPAAAGLSYASGFNRSQDQQSMAAAAKANASQPKSPEMPWWLKQHEMSVMANKSGNTGLPSGGAFNGVPGYGPAPTSAGGTWGDPRTMSLPQLNAELGIGNFDYGRTIPANYSNGAYTGGNNLPNFTPQGQQSFDYGFDGYGMGDNFGANFLPDAGLEWGDYE